jgi:hypothetical protein
MYLPELIRFTVYEYIDICTIPNFYKRDKKLFDLIIKKHDMERRFSLNKLSFLKRNYKRLDIQLNDVVMDGNLECIKWMRYKGFNFDCSTFSWAARRGNLELMKWLLKKNCSWQFTVNQNSN